MAARRRFVDIICVLFTFLRITDASGLTACARCVAELFTKCHAFALPWGKVTNTLRYDTIQEFNVNWTRSQAVARIADRTASQHLRGRVTSSVTWPFDSPYAISYWWSFGTKPLSLTVSEIFNAECSAMVNMTLIRPLNEGQGHSFWYQSISHIRLLIGCQ